MLTGTVICVMVSENLTFWRDGRGWRGTTGNGGGVVGRSPPSWELLESQLQVQEEFEQEQTEEPNGKIQQMKITEVKWKSKCKKNYYHKNMYDKPEPYKLPIVYYKNICYKINVYFNSNSVLWYLVFWVQDVNVLPFHYYNYFCQTKNSNLQHYLTIIWWF